MLSLAALLLILAAIATFFWLCEEIDSTLSAAGMSDEWILIAQSALGVFVLVLGYTLYATHP